MVITPAQIKAARAMLDWSAEDLGKRIGVAKTTISAIETGRSHGSIEAITAITSALESGGIEFADGGVRPRQNRVSTLTGTDGLKTLMDDVYESAKSRGGEICLHNAKPTNWVKWLGDEWFQKHNKRMSEIKENFTLKITAKMGDNSLLANAYAEYRWIPEKQWDEKSFYVYGDKIAFIDFDPESVTIYVLKQEKFANSFKKLFNIMWEKEAVVPATEREK